MDSKLMTFENAAFGKIRTITIDGEPWFVAVDVCKAFVYNNCGLGWSFGRLGAEGLRQICAYVSPANARPGDLIFFQGTYDTTGASHVGIYVGNNTMLHCGDPIQYSDITSSYWQQHFYQFGRLPSP